MATITFARTTDSVNGAQMGMSASINFPDIIATGSTFSLPTVTGTMTSATYNSSSYIQTQYQNSAWFQVTVYADSTLLKYGRRFSSGYLMIGSSSGWATKNWTATPTETQTSGTNLNTSTFFKASNKTVRSVPITLNGSWQIINDWSTFANYSSVTGTGTAYLTLDVPPTATISNISYDTNFVYTGLTTASVMVSNATAYYGGDISSVTLTIGSQSVSRSDNGVLSILLANVGTFTPTVTVTDSRGQTTTKTLDPITVNGYVAPSVSFTADRTLSTGVPDDEGTYGTVDATFTFTDVVADAVAPSVVVTDENGTQTTPTVTWYTTRASDGTLSGTLSDWSTLSSGDTVYGLIPNLNTQYSYQISIRPRDSEGTGTAITQTLSSAFYTVDFLAGGHGIAFGQSASDEGFYCNMDAHFADANSVMRDLFDFIHPVGSYYETSDTSFDPNVTWGGTWVLETEGQVHVSAGTNYTVSGALTDTTDGGSADAIVPYHNHSVSAVSGAITGGAHQHTLDGNASSVAKGSNYVRPRSTGQATANQYYTTSNTHTHDLPAHNTDYVGTSGNTVGANMQPYIVVNRWHRTA